MAGRRRGRIEIWVDILRTVDHAQRGRPRGVLPSRVQARTNLPHGRFWEHVRRLEAMGLLETAPLAVTPAGHEFLRRCTAMQLFLDDGGVSAAAGAL